MSEYTDEIYREWEKDGVIHQIIHHKKDIDKEKPKIEKRGRLDILQDLTEQGAQWEITTEELTNWFRVRAEDHVKVFNNIRGAIDWIIEQICEKGI